MVHPEFIKLSVSILNKAKYLGAINDFYVTNCGGGLELIMTYHKGVNSEDSH